MSSKKRKESTYIPRYPKATRIPMFLRGNETYARYMRDVPDRLLHLPEYEIMEGNKVMIHAGELFCRVPNCIRGLRPMCNTSGVRLHVPKHALSPIMPGVGPTQLKTKEEALAFFESLYSSENHNRSEGEDDDAEAEDDIAIKDDVVHDEDYDDSDDLDEDTDEWEDENNNKGQNKNMDEGIRGSDNNNEEFEDQSIGIFEGPYNEYNGDDDGFDQDNLIKYNEYNGEDNDGLDWDNMINFDLVFPK